MTTSNTGIDNLRKLAKEAKRQSISINTNEDSPNKGIYGILDKYHLIVTEELARGAVQAIEAEIARQVTEAYKKGYIDGGINELVKDGVVNAKKLEKT